MTDILHIALAFHDASGTYARHAGVTLQSLFSHTTARICVHILHDETLCAANRAKLCSICRQFGQQVIFYLVGMPKSAETIYTNHLTKGTLYRLMLASVLPASVEKVLYLDCDIIVELDVAEIWQFDLGNAPLAAVLDEGIDQWSFSLRGKVQSLGINLADYYNSGLILFQMEFVRQTHDLLLEMVVWSQRFPDNGFVDQNFLNYTFRNQYYQLGRQYNRLACSIATGEDFASRQPAIWHFAGEKPWQRVASDWDILYWRYLLQTPWREAAVVFMAKLLEERQRILTSRSWRILQPYRMVGDWLRQKGPLL